MRILLASISFWIGGALALSNAVVSLQSKPTFSRLSLNLDDSIPIQFTENRQGFELIIKNFTPEDLGLLSGNRFQDQRARFEVRESGNGTAIIGSWRFQPGEDAPDQPKMEVFQFRSREPNRYVMDFWVKPGPTVKEARAIRSRLSRQAVIRRAEERANERQRLIQQKELRKEVGQDLSQYCSEPLSDQNDVFLAFNPYHEKFDLSSYLPASKPDRDFPFLAIKSSKNEEGEDAKTALNLYQNENKPGLAMKAIELFSSKYPKSKLLPELQFLKASIYWRVDQPHLAEKTLSDLSRKSPESAPGFHALLFLVTRSMARDNHVTTFEIFQKLILKHGTHTMAWVFRVGSAEALFALGQTERGITELQWVADHAPTDDAKAQAAYRIGDFHMQRGQFAQALASYYRAAQAYPQYEKKFASTQINRAEGFYRLGESEKAFDAYREFLSQYPAHPAGWRATYRMAEISARNEHSSPSDAKAREWWKETVNRYPSSPGAVLARIRLLPCGDHAGFDSSGVQRFLATEANRFTGDGEIQMRLYNDYLSLAKIRALVGFSEREKALAEMSRFEESRMPGVGKEILNRYFPKLFRSTIEGMVAEGRVIDALDIFEKYSALYKKNVDSMEMDFLLKLAKQANDLKLGVFAEKVSTFYRDISQYGQERGIASQYSDLLRLEKSLEKSEQKFIEGKAIWQRDAEKSKEQVKELLAQVIDESPFSAEKEIILAKVYESEKDDSKAIAHIMKAQAVLPKNLSSMSPRLSYWSAQMYAKAGKPEVASSILKSLADRTPGEKDLTGLGLPSWGEKRDLLFEQATLFEKSAKWKEAVRVYESLIAEKNDENRTRYSLAKALEKSGGKSEKIRARKLLEEVSKSPKNDFWKDLATKSLDQTTNQGG